MIRLLLTDRTVDEIAADAVRVTPDDVAEMMTSPTGRLREYRLPFQSVFPSMLSATERRRMI